jgi:hypothetical protein
MTVAVTAHGLRSPFRDRSAERTSHQSEVIEMALAHTTRNQLKAAYRRGDLLEKRRQLMDDWANYCSGNKSSKVINIHEKVSA